MENSILRHTLGRYGHATRMVVAGPNGTYHDITGFQVCNAFPNAVQLNISAPITSNDQPQSEINLSEPVVEPEAKTEEPVVEPEAKTEEPTVTEEQSSTTESPAQ